MHADLDGLVDPRPAHSGGSRNRLHEDHEAVAEAGPQREAE